MTADERIGLVRLRIDRAKEHLRNLETEIDLFLDGLNPPPYEIAVQRDSKTGDLLYQIVSVRPIPSRISVLAGDVIHNCRTVLDHLAGQFFLVNNPGATIPKDTGFPIFKDATAYNSPQKTGKVKGMRQNAVSFIDSLEPYHGGWGTLWELHALDNIDKHRLLLTVACSNQGRTITEGERAKLLNAHAAEDVARIKYIGAPRTEWNVPLQAGYVFYRAPPNSEVDKNMKIGAEITLSEPGIIERESLLETLSEFMRQVEDIVVVGSRPFLV